MSGPMDGRTGELVTALAKHIAHAADVDTVMILTFTRKHQGPNASVGLACYGRSEDDTPETPARISKLAALVQGAATMLIAITGGSVDIVLPETPVDFPQEG
jgi:hypothetical protein